MKLEQWREQKGRIGVLREWCSRMYCSHQGKLQLGRSGKPWWKWEANESLYFKTITLCWYLSYTHRDLSYGFHTCIQMDRHERTHMQKYVHIHSIPVSSVWRWTGGEGGEGEGMQQLSSRDCDKWLSMTLPMKERFSSAWEERGIREDRRKRERSS